MANVQLECGSWIATQRTEVRTSFSHSVCSPQNDVTSAENKFYSVGNAYENIVSACTTVRMRVIFIRTCKKNSALLCFVSVICIWNRLNAEASYKRGNGSPENGVIGSSLNEGKIVANT